MEFGLDDPLASFQELQSDTISDLFASESDHMPSQNFLSSSVDSDLHVTLRWKAIFHVSQLAGNLDPFIPYLAVNYMDRFMSKQEIQPGKPWLLRLLVISCLSLAAKMKNTPFSHTDFQSEEGYIFDVQAISKMELLILDALDWRLRSTTPFPFLDFFLSLLELKDPPFIQALKCRATEIIFNSHSEVKLLEYKPSIIAASVLLSACNELFPLQFPSFKASILSCEYVNRENLMKCFSVLQEVESMLDRVSYTKTQLGVPGRPCTEWRCKKINTTDTTVGTEERDIKRRRLNGVCFEIK